jgi:hypothetical protein
MGAEIWAGVVIPSFATAVTVCQAWEARKARKEAKESEDRALEAAKDASSAAARLADASEKIAELAQREEERKTKKAPPWCIECQSGSTYALKNLSGERMDRVNISMKQNDDLTASEFPTSIDGSSQKSFIYTRSAASGPDRSLTVTWIWPDGTPDSWTGEIPAS